MRSEQSIKTAVEDLMMHLARESVKDHETVRLVDRVARRTMHDSHVIWIWWRIYVERVMYELTDEWDGMGMNYDRWAKENSR